MKFILEDLKQPNRLFKKVVHVQNYRFHPYGIIF